ncbi:MAG: dTDP-glucose 4,6-dehydratase [Cyanobacteria bacterium P01_H01_bin.121]
MQTFLVTGGAGFIGSNFVLMLRERNRARVINLDKLTYASNLQNLDALQADPQHIFVQGDIGDRELLQKLLAQYQPDAVINFAAESHVDRSILNPEAFIETNIVGTFRLLDTTLSYWQSLEPQLQSQFRFLHVSTDEVYGSLSATDPEFREDTPYSPNSPYSASKAASDHLVRAYQHTYQLPTLTTNCSNNYGPYQFPEKLIPLVILKALQRQPLPVYGDGQNIRDWLYVTDHCEAIDLVLQQGRVGETYNIGGLNEQTNLDIVQTICRLLDELKPVPDFHYGSLIQFVRDRPGHDRRYAIDCNKLQTELGWSPREDFASGLLKTVRWYLDHETWVGDIQSGAYRQWLEQNYGRRAGSTPEAHSDS